MSISKLQWRKMRYDGEQMSTSRSLSANLLTKPEISRTVNYIFGEKYPLSYLTLGRNAIGNTENFKKVGNSEFQWPLIGHMRKTVAIVGDTEPAPANKPGLNFSPFSIVLEDKYAALGDILIFPSGKHARVQSDPYQVGNKWKYTCAIIGNDPTDYIEESDLSIGNQLGVGPGIFEEGSRGGSSKQAYPMWFRNQLITCRTKMSITGSALTDAMVLDFGKGKKLWMYEKEYQVLKKMQEDNEYLRWYSKYNRTANDTINLPGESGRPVLSGAGVLEQIEGSNNREYQDLDEEFLRDYLADLQTHSNESENSKYVVFTGTTGMMKFQRAMQDAYQGSIVDASDYFIKSDGNTEAERTGRLKYGNSFTAYEGINGTTIFLVMTPAFDNTKLHTDFDPETGRPYESGRMVFLDMGDYNGEPNIQAICKGSDGIDRSLRMKCVNGMHSYGNIDDMKSAATDFDGFECNWISETGMKVTNPISCGQLIPRRK